MDTITAQRPGAPEYKRTEALFAIRLPTIALVVLTAVQAEGRTDSYDTVFREGLVQGMRSLHDLTIHDFFTDLA